MGSKNVIVTGAASGIGATVCRTLLYAGHSVIGLDLDVPKDESFPILECDITDRAAVSSAVEQACRGLGGIEGLVSCAGVISMVHLDNLTEEEYNRVISVNLSGTLNICQAAYPILRQSRGSVVLLASIAARTGGVESGPAYAASKGGVVSFGKWLAQNGAEYGVRVNTVCPGPVETPMIAGQGYDTSGSGIPLGRLGEPSDISHTIEFLISDKSSWLTGQTIDVNGGLYIN